MMAVIFEVWPADGQRDTYLQMAAALREDLLAMDGFISIDRFESLYEPGKMLSLSFWRDEASLAAWRALDTHRRAQSAGRSHVFGDYRLRIASVVRDYGLNEREQAPSDSRRAHG
jgi:heme-degrading monooxygenase HmoA